MAATGFCGPAGTGWALAGTLNPCFFNTGAAIVLVVAAVASALLQGGAARRLAAAARGREYLLPRPSGGVAHAQLGAAALLLGLHGFALLWSATQVAQPAYINLSEALLLAAWGAFVVRRAWRLGQADGSGRHAGCRCSCCVSTSADRAIGC